MGRLSEMFALKNILPTDYRGFTLVESALCLSIIALIISGVFMLAKSMQADLVFENAKSDTVQLLTLSRNYLEVMPPLAVNADAIMDNIKLPTSFVKSVTDHVYQTSYAPNITLLKTIYNNQDSLKTVITFYSPKFSQRYCEFFQNHLREYDLQTVLPTDCADDTTPIIIYAHVQNGI